MALSPAATIRMKPGGKSYDFILRRGGIREVVDLMSGLLHGQRVFVVTDSNVTRIAGRMVLMRLVAAGVDAVLVDFPAGEHSKNASMVEALHSRLLLLGIRRDSLLITVGGGVVGDLAGFVASTILRGVATVNIPTTLLAQVDSSIGGKVGINHPLGKNLVGAFHHPLRVICDPDILRSLPLVEYRNGLAEMTKIAAALDGRLFRKLEREAAALARRDIQSLTPVLHECVALKASVIRHDERDTGLRASLNLGHTIGHAIEQATGFRIPHGKAVALGLSVESRIAARRGMLSTSERNRLLNLLHGFRLPVTMPRAISIHAVLHSMHLDKKATSTGPSFVLLNGMGSCAIGVMVSDREVTEAFSDVR